MVTVLGEVDEKELYINEIRRVLKKGATVTVSEQVGDPDILKENELIDLFNPRGFRLKRKYGRKLYYTFVFEKLE